MSYKSKREFLDIGGYVSDDTVQMRQQILAMDELFLEDGNEQQQLDNEEHQQQLEEDESCH